MKLVSINAWAGNLFDPLISFVKKNSNADIFLFQEMWSTPSSRISEGGVRANLLQEIQKILPSHIPYFAVTQEGVTHHGIADFEIANGNAIFVRSDINVVEHGEVFVHRDKNQLILEKHLAGDYSTNPRLMQFVQIQDQGVDITIFNFHGYWDKSGKGDTPERFAQAEKIASFVNKFQGRKILAGDFNLNIDSKSLTVIEGSMRNLIKEFKIKTTRPDIYPKKALMPYADYTLVSSDIEVKNFTLPDEGASDHLPMVLEFE